MKILLDATVFEIPFTGVAKSTLGLYNACIRNYQLIEICGVHKKPLSASISDTITTISPYQFLPNKYWAQFVFLHFSKKIKPHIIHFPWNGNIPKGLSKYPVAITLHDVLPLEMPGPFLRSKAERRYRKKVQDDLNRSDLVFTVSHYSKERIQSEFKVKNEPIVIHSGPTISALTDNNYGVEEEDFFLYLGGYSPRKGIESLLEVFIQLLDKKKVKSKLLFIGTPLFISDRFSQLLVKGKEMNGVQEKGYLSDSQISGLLQKAKGLIYPSKYEGFGLPPLEAMSIGCPVITTHYTSLREVCNDAVIYIEPDNKEDFANAIIKLDQDKTLRNELRQKGKKQAMKFSWEKTSKIFIESIEQLLGKKITHDTDM